MFRSAVFKLTIAYVAIVMSISVMFSVLLYNLAIRELQLGFQNQYTRWLTEYQPFGLRQPGNPAAELAARSAHIWDQIIYFNILVLVATAIVSYLLARRTLRPIERAHEQQKRFTADVSHELRTPLTALKMETEVALLDPAASKQALRQTLESNLEEAERMEGLVNNLLQLASLEANQLRTEFSRTNMREVVEKALGVVAKYADMKQVSVETKLMEAYVDGNRPSLTQLCVILFENAIKYSPPESKITVRMHQVDYILTVEIIDEGMGIPGEALPHVFDRFYRADDARSAQGAHGFGLGLSLAKLIADLHSGEITLTSRAQQGTTAAISLPALRHPKR